MKTRKSEGSSMQRQRIWIPLILAIILPAGPSLAAPPPPPLPGVAALPEALEQSYNSHNTEAYRSLFHPDVLIKRDGVQIGAGIDAWVKLRSIELARASTRIASVASDYDGNLFVTEEVSLMGFGVANDCCWWGRVTKYTVRENKISSVDVLSGFNQGSPLLRGGVADRLAPAK